MGIIHCNCVELRVQKFCNDLLNVKWLLMSHMMFIVYQSYLLKAINLITVKSCANYALHLCLQRIYYLI